MTERKRRGTKLSSLNKTKKEAEKHSKNPLSTGGGFLDFHKIEEGRNEFRIMPPVKGDDLSYYPKRTAWLEVEVPSKEDISSFGDSTENISCLEAGSKSIETELTKCRIFLSVKPSPAKT